MNWSTKSCSQICRTRCNVAKMIVVSKLYHCLNVSCSSAESLKDLVNICSWLHWDDTKLVFFVYPHQECLVIIVEDSSAWWPVTIEIASLKESISFFEQEMIFDELLLIFLAHAIQRIESTFEISSKCITSLNYFCHNLISLYFWNAWS